MLWTSLIVVIYTLPEELDKSFEMIFTKDGILITKYYLIKMKWKNEMKRMEKKKKVMAIVIAIVIAITIGTIAGVQLLQKPPKYCLTIQIVGQGITEPAPGNYTYEERSKVSIIAFPIPGWKLDYWSGDASGNQSSIIVNMGSDKTITANFVEITVRNYSLTINVVGEGTTDPASGVYEYRSWTFINITAIPSPGWFFDYWSSGGINGSQNPLIVVMNQNRTVTAFFKEIVLSQYLLKDREILKYF